MVSTRSWDSTGSHSQVITHELQSLLNEEKIELKKIDQILIGVGPGSFTGIRIGLNLAKSLAYSFELPVFEYSSLVCCAEPAAQKGNKNILSLVNAFRNLYYCSKFKQEEDGSLTTVVEASALTLDEITPLLNDVDCLVGDAAEELADKKIEIFRDGITPQAANYVSLFYRQTKVEAMPKVWNEVSPLYVRASEAEEKLKKL